LELGAGLGFVGLILAAKGILIFILIFYFSFF